MDLMGLFLIGMGIFLVVFVGVLMYAALMRMTGRRSRFDRFAEPFVRAQAAAVYPPSLHGEPDAPVIEEIEVHRATDSSRRAPGQSSPKSADK